MTGTRLLSLGDSHLEALQFAADIGLLDTADNHFCIIPGATAVGLRNPHSATQALTSFRQFVTPHPRTSHLLVHLGEVDCGFVIWWRLQKHGETVDSQLQESLSAYRGFLLDLLAMGFERICIAGASLPTLESGVDFGAVANMRAEVKASLLERTELTERYNKKLASMAADLACSYFDVSSGIMNRVTGVVSDYFRNPDPWNQHVDKYNVAGMWAMACNNFLRTRRV